MVGMRIVASAVAFLAAIFCLAEAALFAFIAYRVHLTGQFHGMSGFHVGTSLRFAGMFLAATLILAWVGTRSIRRSIST
jgi:hypothetical protein